MDEKYKLRESLFIYLELIGDHNNSEYDSQINNSEICLI